MASLPHSISCTIIRWVHKKSTSMTEAWTGKMCICLYTYLLISAEWLFLKANLKGFHLFLCTQQRIGKTSMEFMTKIKRKKISKILGRNVICFPHVILIQIIWHIFCISNASFSAKKSSSNDTYIIWNCFEISPST